MSIDERVEYEHEAWEAAKLVEEADELVLIEALQWYELMDAEV